MRFCCMVVRRGPAVYDTMYGLTLYELISLRALLRLRGRRSVAALPAAPCAAWRPLLRRTAGTRAATPFQNSKLHSSGEKSEFVFDVRVD